MHPYVYSGIIYNSQVMEAAQMSIDRRMDKDVVYTCNGTLFSHKKWDLAVSNNMDGAREYNAMWNKSEKDVFMYFYKINEMY